MIQTIRQTIDIRQTNRPTKRLIIRTLRIRTIDEQINRERKGQKKSQTNIQKYSNKQMIK